jgi:ATP-dependent Clp protease protease subunit
MGGAGAAVSAEQVALIPRCAVCGEVWLPDDEERWRAYLDTDSELVFLLPWLCGTRVRLLGFLAVTDTPLEHEEAPELDGRELPADEEAPPSLSTVYVSFSAEISPQTTESLIATLANCANNPDVQEVHLLMSTPGGSVMHGMNLYNVMRAMPFRLITHNVGNVDSIGNAIFLAGEQRFACPHTTFMFHGVGFDQFSGAPRLEEKYLRELMGGLLSDQNRIAAVIEERTNLDASKIEPLFLEAQTKDATYAIGVGIVHEIKDVEIPRGAPVIALVFQR